MCEECHQLLAVGRWFPPGTPVSSTRKLISSSSSSFHRLGMTLAVAEALNPNKPNLFIYLCRFGDGNYNLDLARGVPRTFGGGGVGVPRSAKQANKPNKHATELKPRPCAHQGSMFRPYTSVCFVERSIFTTLV